MADDPKTTDLTKDALELLATIGLTYHQATVAAGADGWIVMIWKPQKKPPIVKWRGWSVSYRIGGGPPQAFGALAT